MFLFKKKIPICLYIFFIFLTFNFTEFSTNIAYSKTFVVSKIEVEEEYNLNFNKIKVIDRGFKKAFQNLSQMILEVKDLNKITDTSIEDIKKLVDNFSILDEKFVNQKYKNTMEVEFNRKKLIKFFNTKNIILSLPKKIDVFFLPILVDLETNSFNYLNDDIFVKNWENIQENYFQINYILPNEDIEDFSIIRKNIGDIENYNFNEIFNKYNVKNRILLVLLNQDNLLKVFSKLNLENNEMFINKNFNDVSMKNLDQINDVILDLKNDFENKWKSLNEINTSIILPIRLSVDSNNFLLSNNLENYLNGVDLISNYKIENFNSKQIIYKIIFNSTPDKFLKIMENSKFKIDTSKDVWKLQ